MITDGPEERCDKMDASAFWNVIGEYNPHT